MKKRYTITIFISLVLAGTAMAQIPNASFEDWTEGAPDGWTVSNIPPTIYSIFESDEAYEGSKSALVTTVSQAGFDVGGLLTATNFPYASSDESITGWYKPNFLANDKITVACTLTDMGMAAVSVGVGDLTGTSNVWTAFVVGLLAATQNAVAYGTVSFQLTNSEGSVFATAGSECNIDEVAFGGPVGIAVHETVSTTKIENVYPNPSNGVSLVQYILPQASQVSIALYDTQGREVMQVLDLFQAPGQYRAEVNTQSLETGIYQVVLHDGTSVHTATLVKN
jgi:hypothetical protein